MLSINNLSFYFGSRALYDGASLHIKPKDKIGLIGANGTGKSTLLRILTGEYQPDGGNISKSGDCTIGFLNQDLLSYQTEESILSVAMQAFERENRLQHQIDAVLHEMETNYRDELVDKLTRYQDEFDALGGYTAQARSEEILEGLGFTTHDLTQPLKSFSGGWRMRVMLAKLLLQRPALLLLDEPTNHLDLPSIEWVEKYINDYEGAIIVVSHDRYFLDNTVTTIVEVSGGKLNLYAGNFSFYIEEKDLRNEIQKGAFENQQAKIRQTERFIERFRAKASKSKQVQSRVKALDRLDMVDDVVDEAARVNFKFTFGQQPGRHILHLEDVSKAYGEKKILERTHAGIERGDKIALIGANGKGKSTLLRIIAGTENIQGERRTGHNVLTTFFAQHQLEALHLDNSMLEELKQAGSAKTEMELRGILGCFLFSNDEVFKKIRVLSGGEKSRVALAKALLSEANFLLLDEPTNHLDMVSVNILIQALQQYEGSYVVISHDRFFVSQVANKIWYIEDYQLKEYPGSFDEFEVWKEERARNGKTTAAAPDKNTKAAPKGIEPKANGKPAASEEAKRGLKQANQQLEAVEEKIGALEQKQLVATQRLADPRVLNSPADHKEANAHYADLKKQLDRLQGDWEKAAAAVDEWEKKLVGA